MEGTKASHVHIYYQDNFSTSALALEDLLIQLSRYHCPLLHQLWSKKIKACPIGRLL